MRPTLVSVAFDHPAAATRPVPVRRNATTPVGLPEWRAGASVAPVDAPVAFAVDGLDASALSVQVVLAADVSTHTQVEVRARAIVPWGAGPAALGGVATATVTFDAAHRTVTQVLRVEDVRLADRGVGVHDLEWAWQARPGPGWPWSRIATTRHRVYALLRAPVEPWSVSPRGAGNAGLPWTELLEYACRWAAGARTPEAVAERVTAAINFLGAGVAEYDCPGFGGTHYTLPFPTFHVFDCSQFLRLLRGLPYASRYVNCMDCAAMVSTTANLLGCELWQSGMGNEEGLSFDCFPILAIGSRTWQTPCGWGGFSYHEVAWTGAGEAGDAVYDACLQVDGGTPPGQPPFAPLLPAGLRFDSAGTTNYRDRLATPAGRVHCEPQPDETRRRRMLM